jgi:ADP-heptose:LPS heptosyltransferase
MFRKLIRKLRPNPLDSLLEKAAKKNHKTFLLGWNRGLGDIPLGLYAIVHRIKWFIPDAKVSFMIRPSLKEGFSLFKDVRTIVAPWKRGDHYSVKKTLLDLKIDKKFDVIIEKPDPTYWVKWQLNMLQPKLSWENEYDEYHKKFELPEGKFIAVQTHSDTSHSPWRDWKEDRWEELFKRLGRKKNIKVLLLGIDKKREFKNKCLIDLRGKTSLLEVLSIIKNRCSHLIVPDGGILSLTYFLQNPFPIKIVSLWCECQGILKQNVDSPNPLLSHEPIVRKKMEDITVDEVLEKLFN